MGIYEQISNDDIKLKVNKIDIFYQYKDKNKISLREEKDIVTKIEIMRNKLNDLNIDNYFIDIAYRIVPKLYLNYKLMIIAGIDKKTNNTFICVLILLIYEFYISFLNFSNISKKYLNKSSIYKYKGSTNLFNKI